MQNFGNRLRELRKKQGLTQAELAYLVGVHETTIRRWETGSKGTPSIDEIQKLCAALNVSENELLNGSPDIQERWVLQLKIADKFTQEVIDVSKSVPCVSSITTTPNGGFLCLGGDYSLWTDDNAFKKLLADVKKFRATVIQNGKALGGIKDKD